MGHAAALIKSHMNGLKPFERTIEQTTETMPPSPKTITAAAMTTNCLFSGDFIIFQNYKLADLLKF